MHVGGRACGRVPQVPLAVSLSGMLGLKVESIVVCVLILRSLPKHLLA